MRIQSQLSRSELRRVRKIQSELASIQKADFRDEVCGVYDLMVGAGIEHAEAIRKTRSALRAINYPHVTYDVVMASLRANGRLRKQMRSAKDQCVNG